MTARRFGMLGAVAMALGCGSPADPGVPPNILLISMDTVRADHLSVYGARHETSPNLARLGLGGVVFENAIAQGNESIYSHGAIFTGRYASEIASPTYETYAIPPSALLIPEVLRAYGYETGAFVAGGHVGAPFGFDQGYDEFIEQPGFASFFDTMPGALTWLKARDSGRPWFAFVHSYDAHRPYVSPGPWSHLYSGGPGSALAESLAADPALSEMVADDRFFPDVTPTSFVTASGKSALATSTYTALRERARLPGGTPITQADVDHIQAHYDGAIAYEDLLLGAFFSTLENDGLLENTLIIVLSDHGEDLLDHGMMNHRTGLFDSCIHVATIVSGPGFPRGTRIPDLVEQLDIAPTIYRAARATPPGGLVGRALQDVASGVAVPLDAVYTEGVMDMVSVRTPTHKLVYAHAPLADPNYLADLAGVELAPDHFTLFDLKADPTEQENVLGSEPEIAESLRQKLLDWRRSLALGKYLLPQDQVDPAVAEEMRKHGYWGAPTAK